MLITNLTIGTIILPSQHRLPPGENEIPETILFGSKNKNFVNELSRIGRISFTGITGSPQQSWVASDEGPLTRLSLAKMTRMQVIEMGIYFEAIEDRNYEGDLTDDIRLTVAEKLFG